jgi:hypothetical protein
MYIYMHLYNIIYVLHIYMATRMLIHIHIKRKQKGNQETTEKLTRNHPLTSSSLGATREAHTLRLKMAELEAKLEALRRNIKETPRGKDRAFCVDR